MKKLMAMILALALLASLNLNTGEEEPLMSSKLSVSFNGHTYTATLADNPSVDAFVEYLKSQGGSVVVHAHDYGNFEKVGELGTTIVQTNTQINTVPGDLILYTGNNICLYYSTNSWNFTRLGKLEGDLSNLKSDLGSGDVDITYTLADTNTPCVVYFPTQGAFCLLSVFTGSVQGHPAAGFVFDLEIADPERAVMAFRCCCKNT